MVLSSTCVGPKRDRSSASGTFGTFGTFYQKYSSGAVLLVLFTTLCCFEPYSAKKSQHFYVKWQLPMLKLPKVPQWSGTFGTFLVVSAASTFFGEKIATFLRQGATANAKKLVPLWSDTFS